MHPAELLARFDDWELRTRGVIASADHVAVEPKFTPLFARERTARHMVDDSRRPGLLERLWRVHGTATLEVASEASEPPAAGETGDSREVVELELLAPRDFSLVSGEARAWLGSLHAVREPIGVEIVGLPERVSLQLACSRSDRDVITSATRAFFREVKLRARENYLASSFGTGKGFRAAVSFGLKHRVFRLLQTAGRFDIDPLIGVASVLDEVRQGEVCVVQVLLAPARAHWREEFDQFASSIEDIDRVLPLIREKFSEPLFAAVLRVAALAPTDATASRLAHRLTNAVVAATRTPENEIIPLDDAPDKLWSDVLARATRRHGMLLSLSEVMSLVHPPDASVRSERWVRLSSRTKPAPAAALGHSLILGLNEHDGERRLASLSVEHRLRHTYLIGASGTGKSTLMLQMVVQDLEAGHGLAVLDPHGDLVDDLMARIPEHRIADVVLFDPADESHPVGFNVLTAHSELERTLLCSDLVSVFRRLSTSFGDQMVAVLGNAVAAFLEHPEGGTLVDLRRFLIDKTFRAQFLENVRDDQVVSYWHEEYPLLKGLPHAPLLTRLNTFLRPKLIRHMVAQKQDRLDMRAIMDGRKILLARLAQGGIGEENAHLLGSLLVARIAQAAMSRQETALSERAPFFLYIDEFHHFITPSIAAILSGARKYGVGLTLAHQEMRQLRARSEEVTSAVLSNAATRVVFRVGDQDAKMLAEGLSFFTSRDLQNLGVGEAIVRLERPDQDFNLRTEPAAEVAVAAANERRTAVRSDSRARYGASKDEVEAVLRASSPSKGPDQPTGPRATRRRKESSSVVAGEGSPVEIAERLPGRGGMQHKYIQSLVRKLAEDRGFTVTIEKRLFDGRGHVDALLERDGESIACEISVSTSGAHEAMNLTKCIAAGYTRPVLIYVADRVVSEVSAILGPSASRGVEFVPSRELVKFFDSLPVRYGGGVSILTSQRNAGDPESGRRLLTTSAAAAYMKRSIQTLAKMRWSGNSPPFYKVGAQVLYDADELDAWLARRKQQSTADTRGRSPA